MFPLGIAAELLKEGRLPDAPNPGRADLENPREFLLRGCRKQGFESSAGNAAGRFHVNGYREWIIALECDFMRPRACLWDDGVRVAGDKMNTLSIQFLDRRGALPVLIGVV